MIWNLNCRRTRHELALSGGNDNYVEERPSPRTQRHLAVCPRCRETWQGLRHSQRVLERVSVSPVEEKQPTESAGVFGPDRSSIWPDVARQLRVIDEEAAAPNWRGWLPAGALAAACLAIIVVATAPDQQLGFRTVDSRRPVVIYPQPASATADGVGYQRYREPVAEEEGDVPARGVRHSGKMLKGDDEPRSF